MKYPLDRVCVKSGIFCPSCQRKLDSGEVDYSEIEVIKTLIELEEKNVELRKGVYVKSYMVNNTTVLILKNGWDRMQLNKIARELGNKLGRRVKIALLTGDQRALVEQLLAPARVLGINVIWLPDGSEQISIRVPSRDKKKIGKINDWEKIFTKLLGKPTRIVFV